MKSGFLFGLAADPPKAEIQIGGGGKKTKMKQGTFALVVFLTAIFTPALGIPPGYSLTDLGTLGGDATSPQGINDLGQVVGYSRTGVREWIDTKYGGYWLYQEQAFLNNNGSSMINLGTLGGWFSYAYDINERGQVTGFAATAYSTYHAFLWDSAGLYDLGTLSTRPTAVSDAYGVNDLGHVTGSSSIDPWGERAYIHRNGVMTNIGALSAKIPWSQASDINNHDQIVGRSFFDTDLSPYRAFLWENGQMTQLGTLGGFQSWALAINDVGQVVGWADIGSPLNQTNHAFLWDSTGGMIDLRTLGGLRSTARGINNLGHVVGTAQTAEGRYHAFIWENGHIVDLNDLIDPTSGWELTVGNDINNFGQIAGNGTYNGQERAFLLTIIPEPSSLLAFASGLVGLGGMMYRRRKR